MATVDVLVPAYNRPTMLRKCLESIRVQTYTDIEVTIGDDGVNDDVRVVAQGFCSVDSRFHYVHNAARLGIFGNTNALFTRATAPYVHFMHDDDWLEPEFYERMVAGLEESPEAGLAWPGAKVSKGENETNYVLQDAFSHDRVLPGDTAFHELLHGNFIPCPAVVLRTSVLREVGPFAEYLTADWLMWLRVALHHDLKYIDAPLFHYRLHEEQESADICRMGKDGIDMFAYATGLEEFVGRHTEIATARFEFVCRWMMALTDDPQERRMIRDLTSYFLTRVPDHHSAVVRVEISALALTMVPMWLRPRKGGRTRHWLRRLFLPWSKT